MGAKSDVLLPFNLTEVTKMCFCCFKRSLKQTVHLSDRSLSDWAIQFRAIVFLNIYLNRSGEGHIFLPMAGGGSGLETEFSWEPCLKIKIGSPPPR